MFIAILLTSQAFLILTQDEGCPCGIGAGGRRNKFQLFINHTLDYCTTTNTCETFEAGQLIPSTNNSIEQVSRIRAIEVWGTGGDEWIARGIQKQKLFMSNNNCNI